MEVNLHTGAQTEKHLLAKNGNGVPRTARELRTPASLETIGRLISGYGDQATAQYKAPVIDTAEMARGLKVTFRPIPANAPAQLRQFAEELQRLLPEHGVQVIPWEEATTPSYYDGALPLMKRKFKIPIRLAPADINAIFDVQGRTSWWRALLSNGMELGYIVHRYFSGLRSRHRIREILRLVAWVQNRAVWNIADHVATQVVAVRPLNPILADLEASYTDKLATGMVEFIQSIAPIVLGVSPERMSLLNLNMSDAVYARADVGRLVSKSLIPKLHAPIQPLTRGRFQVGSFAPAANPFTQQVIDLSQRLSPLGLLPRAVAVRALSWRPSTRDIVNELIDGRSGISFGFVACMEPPVYVGPREVSADDWDAMAPARELSPDDVRRSDAGRFYLRTWVGERWVYRQVPDVWIVSSRSGAEKNNLQVDRDLVRLGFNGQLQLQTPEGCSWETSDIRPSYDTYVMIALALGAALYHPHLVEHGAPLVHFHGYPAPEWFQPDESCTGAANPSVACGTFESGVLNFLGMWKLAETNPDLKLACLIEPDHGSNLVACDIDYLVERLQQGVASGQVFLGGKNLQLLREATGA